MVARRGPAKPAKPAKPRQRMSAAEREDQIVAAAIAFFSRRGVDAQIRELAEEIGIAHTLLYHYFPTKQALIDRVYDELFVGRWDPRWEASLDQPMPIEDKLCAFYESYLAAILTPEWMRIIVGSGLSDGVIPGRYFVMLQQRLLPKVIRETRKALGNKSRAKPSAREQALLMGLHGGLVYSLGIWPYVYGQSFEGQGDSTIITQIIRDRVQSYLAHVATVMPGADTRAAGKSFAARMLGQKPPAGGLLRTA
jgi:AcrR family transcriptional regulator